MPQGNLLKQEISAEYALRFAGLQNYRNNIWKILIADFFQQHIPNNAHILDLGCGWGEFINNITAEKKFGMDLNPSTRDKLDQRIHFINQDCSEAWALPDNSLDIVFTSNFFEHLPTKDHLRKTIQQIERCLKLGGRLLCLGPNIKYLPGLYWEFWDHHIPLTEASLSEILQLNSFAIEQCYDRFLPYTMVNKAPPPLAFVKLYLKLPLAWKFFGKQFFIMARKQHMASS